MVFSSKTKARQVFGGLGFIPNKKSLVTQGEECKAKVKMSLIAN